MDVEEVPAVPDWLPDHLRGEGVESLYPPQAEAVEAGVTRGESLVAAVPTASGKTLVATLAMLASVDRGGTALYIVPLRALASEKREEFEAFEEYGLDVGVSTGNYESEGGWLAGKDIIVATSEKVDSLVRNDAPWLDDLTCVVSDEVHLVDDDGRGPTLEVTLAKLRQINPRLQTVALSATIGNAAELAEWLDADLVDSDWRPIELRKGVHYGDALHLEDGSQRRVAVRNSEDQTAGLVRDTLTDETENLINERNQAIEQKLSGTVEVSSSTQSKVLKEEIQNLCIDTIKYTVGDEIGILGASVVNNLSSAEDVAKRYSDTTAELVTPEEEKKLQEIANEIQNVSDTDDVSNLADLLPTGVAFYNERLPEEVKQLVKTAVAEGLVRAAVGTTTAVFGRIDDTKIAAEGGAALIFVNSRNNAEAAARRLASTTSDFLDGDERARLADIAREIREVSDTETSEDLADAVESGAAFHHAGLARRHRSLVEEAFRDRLVKAVCATPTLAAGVNTPSRRVVVRDWRRYDGAAGGMKPLSVLEVHQMMGRAGRPGRDPYGEAVLTANSHDELDELFERYVWADPEPVKSKLAAEPALRTHILATVASGFARSRTGLLDFLDDTLYATQTADDARLAEVVDRVLAYLERNDFLDRADGELTATSLGHTVSRLYLDPMSAAEILDGLRAAGREPREAGEGDFQSAADLRGTPTGDAAPDPEEVSVLGLYHLVARTPDMYELYLRSGDEEEYSVVAAEREAELLGRPPSEFAAEFEDWLSALKTARMLEDWADEDDEDAIAERYDVGPGDIRGKVETAEWLLGAAESLAQEAGVDVVPAVQEARTRVEHGVRAELVDLANVRGVGRKRARRLYEVGVEDRAALREADKSRVLAALRGRRGTAETVLENAGHRDPSMDGVEPAEDVSLDVEAAADGGDDQSSLGDF